MPPAAELTSAAPAARRCADVRTGDVRAHRETAQRGYHETLTRVWLVLVAAARRRAPGPDSIHLLTQPGLERDAPLAYYSRARLFSVAARARFVPPDLADLPG